MTTADDVLDRARSQIGVKEAPPGSNEVLYSRWYGVDGPWCAMFVSWCFFSEGLPLNASTGKGFAYTPAGAEWFRKQGRWSTEPATGRVVFFDFPGDSIRRISHVGIVESVGSNGTIHTIEGNTDSSGGRTGGQVMRRNRSVGIVGYGVPAYDGAAAAASAKTPGFAGTVLMSGATGAAVRILQARLVQLKVAPLDVDGEFGPQTLAAVIAFQKRQHLDADGQVGPITWKALWA